MLSGQCMGFGSMVLFQEHYLDGYILALCIDQKRSTVFVVSGMGTVISLRANSKDLS